MDYIMDYIIQLNYYNYLSFKEYTQLLLTNKKYYYNNIFNNDKIYKNYLINKFSSDFVTVLRQNIISYYLIYPRILSYKECLSRIVMFENNLIKNNIKAWDEEAYYSHWKKMNFLKEEEKDAYTIRLHEMNKALETIEENMYSMQW